MFFGIFLGCSWASLQGFSYSFSMGFSGFLKLAFATFVIGCFKLFFVWVFTVFFRISRFFRGGQELVFNPDSQPQNHPMKKNVVRLGNQTINVPIFGLMILDAGSVQNLFLHGWWQLH